MKILESIDKMQGEAPRAYIYERNAAHEQEQTNAEEHVKLSVDDTRALFAALSNPAGAAKPRFHFYSVDIDINISWGSRDIVIDFYDSAIPKNDLQEEAATFIAGIQAVGKHLGIDRYNLPSNWRMVSRNLNDNKMILFRTALLQPVFVEILEFYRTDAAKFMALFDEGYAKRAAA